MRKATAVFLIAIIVMGMMPSTQSEALADELKFFTLLHTNDEHSALLPTPLSEYSTEYNDSSWGGFARLASLVKSIRHKKSQTNEPVLLVSAGDYLGGSPFAWLALEGRAVELDLMQKLGYDVVAVGNHEYDFGPELFAQYLAAAGYPAAHSRTAVVASNTVPPQHHPLLDAELKSTYLKELPNGLKVGFFSLIGEDAIKKAPLSYPVQFADQFSTARNAVAELKRQGADVIVAINHAGLDEDRALAKTVPGINIIISGHCHTALLEPIIEGATIIVQTGSSLQYLGMLELAYGPTAGQLRVLNREYLVSLDNNIAIDPEFEVEVAAVTKQLNSTVSLMTGGRFDNVAQPIIKSSFVVPNKPEFVETPFGNFVTDAMRIIGSEFIGNKVDFAIQANGVLRGSITPAASPHARGEVALLDLLDLVGLGSGPDQKPGYPLVSVYLTEEEVRRALEVAALLPELMGDDYFLQFSGLRMTYDPSRAVIARIPVKGTPIPSTRAVLSADKYVGNGAQAGSEYVALKRGGKELYHVVTDYYIAQFLPMVGKMLPSLGLVLKDMHGNPIDSIDDAIVYYHGQELKVWKTVLEYAAAQPKGADNIPLMPVYYAGTSARITTQKTVSLLLYPSLLLVLAVWGVVYLVIRRRRLLRA